jgi:hypothetical protein
MARSLNWCFVLALPLANKVLDATDDAMPAASIVAITRAG